MAITREETQHIADLARLKLSSTEVDKFCGELSAILEYMKILNEVDTDNIEHTSQVTGLSNVTREDVVIDSGEELTERLVGCFPEKVEKLLKVPGVFNNKQTSSKANK